MADIPLKDIIAHPEDYETQYTHTYVVCRLGNDSQVAATALRRAFPRLQVHDVIGGLVGWAAHVDQLFPVY
jgi:adenylyltransferase/sulfurtransferase